MRAPDAGRGSFAERMAADPERRAAWLARFGEGGCAILETFWPFWERPDQRPPPGAWRTWLVLAGRGFGKTRMGAEWVRAAAEANGALRIALVGATDGDVRRVMIEGESGLLAIAPPARRPHWLPSLGRLVWPNGAQAEMFSDAEPGRLRGPSHHLAWADEIAKWTNGIETWDNLMLTLRAGTPRAMATTTPRASALVRRLAADAQVVKTRGTSGANRAHLARGYLAAMQADYGGTRWGRQELDGELLEDLEGALWTRATLDTRRVLAAPELVRIVVGVDPPAGVGGDACGIVAVGLGRDGRGYVLEDASVAGRTPEGWAQAVAACAARHGADRVVAETNQGGAMVRSVLRAARAGLPLSLVHAHEGKSARAEPVALLYESGQAWHVGVWPELEDELCGLQIGGGYQGPGRSPDRADALVWAMTELMLRATTAARIRVL